MVMSPPSKSEERGRHKKERVSLRNTPQSVLQAIEKHSKRSPQVMAVTQGARCLTYERINLQANRLAWKLLALGAEREQIIALVQPRCPELIIGALAAWKVGAAYLPIDPSYPPERVAFMIKDAKAKIVLTLSALGRHFSIRGTQIIELDSESWDSTLEGTERPEVSSAANSLAYVIYTSGSTGQPKGVAVEHGSLANLVRWHQDTYELKPTDRCTWLASPGFDASIWEIWSCLASGASLFIPEPELILDPPRLLKWMAEQRVSVAFLPTPLAEAVLRERAGAELALRALLTGGDTLHCRPHSAARYRFFNHYGPTEGTVVATSARIQAEAANDPPSIGKPISNTEIYLLNAELHPVPPGEAGEIVLGGAGLARGYLNNPSLTAEKFIADHVSGRHGTRVYRTGDLGRLRKDGTLEFLGRIDHQVKIRGVRIELGEIEATLKAQPTISDACVVACGDGADKKLVAYIVASQSRAPAPTEIASQLRRSLPDVMVPTVFISVPSLPLTLNGKVDRRALQPPDSALMLYQSTMVPPRNQYEQVVLGIWSSVLRVPCGVHDSFLDLGGNSLSAMQIMARVQEAFGTDLRVHSLFEAPTVAELARVITEARHRTSTPPIVPRGDCEPLGPLSFSQQQFWILNQMDPDNPFYNEQVIVRIVGPLSVAALKTTLAEVTRRHRVLGMCFAADDGIPRGQACHTSVDLPQADLGLLPENVRYAEAVRFGREEALRAFNLAKGPLFRPLMIRVGKDEHWLVVTFHHAIFDGWSVRVFLDEITTLYPLIAAGELVLPEAPQIQYADYAVWQRSWLNEAERERQLVYWRTQLAGLTTLELPTDRPRPSKSTYSASRCRFVIARDLNQRLAELGRQEGATPFMTLLAAWCALLGHLSQQDDVCVGTVAAGRVRTELEKLIGCFTNTLVMRIFTGGNPSFRELLSRARRTALDAFAHQDLPFEHLVQELHPERETGRNSFFQVALVLQPNSPGVTMSAGELTIETIEETGEQARFDLELHAWETESALEGWLLFRTELFDADTAQKIVRGLETFLGNASRSPDDGVDKLLRASETKQLWPPPRRAWVNNTEVDLDQIESVIRRDPSVFDCAVLARTDEHGSVQLVACLVGLKPLDFKTLVSRFAFGLPEAAVPSVFIPVSSIPLTPSGRPDHSALSSLGAIDSDLLQRWEASLKNVRGVLQAGVIVREGRRPCPPLHLADLIPDWQRDKATESVALAPAPTTNQGYAPTNQRLAVSHGVVLYLPNSLPASLAATLQRAAHSSPDKGILYLDAQGAESRLSYPELLNRADRVLGGLRSAGLRAGDKVLFQLPNNLDFLIGFWACQLGGMVPAPLSIPSSYCADNAVAQKLHSAWALLGQPLVLTERTLAPLISSAFENVKGFCVTAIEDLAKHGGGCEWADGVSGNLALLLLTSGSTGKPKAVMHSHKTLLSRSAGEVQWNELSCDDVSLNWLPLDHVASLVQFHLRDVYLACNEIQVATERVLRNPLEWLDLIDRFGATVTWAPNFAFGLINDCALEIGRRKWNLSSMRNLLDGGEAIVSKTARRFLELLEPHGLPPGALHPVWGMSETAAGVTSSKRFSLATTRPEDPFVDVGEPLPGVSFRIVDAHDQVLTEGAIGRLQVCGPTITRGYFNAPEHNNDSFTDDGWFKTGDLGLLQNGRLTITGREKNVIIIHGTNFYSHEIEAVVEEVNGVQISYTAAFAVRRPNSNTDELAICFSPDPVGSRRLSQLLTEIRERLIRQVGVSPTYLLPVEPRDIPKTGIGKIQHALLRQHLEEGKFADLIRRVDVLMANGNTVPAWFFRKIWRRREAPASLNPVADGWIIFTDSHGLGDQFVSRLKAMGAACVTVTAGASFERRGPGIFTLNPGDPESYRELLRIVSTEGFRVRGVLHLWTYAWSPLVQLTSSSMTAELERGVLGLQFLIQALGKSNLTESSVRLLVVSCQAQAVRAEDHLVCERATCLGLLKTAEQEHPWLSCGHVDLPGKNLEIEAAFVLTETHLGKAEFEVAYREGRRFVARLERADFGNDNGRKVPLREGGRYLITGGVRGVGGVLAAYLLREYKARLLVVGRTRLPERSEWAELRREGDSSVDYVNTLLDLEQTNGEIVYATADVCDGAQMREVLGKTEARWGAPLDGVFHLAAVTHECPLMDETPQGLSATLAPKVSGTRTLHELVASRPGTLFVSFSSVNGFFGGTSVSAYAAANSFLDAFCHFQRRTCALSSYCIAWSFWQDLGMSRELQAKEAARARGYQPITSDQGIRSLLVTLAHNEPALLVGLDTSKRNVLRHLETRECGLAELCSFYAAGSDMLEEELARIRVHDRFGTVVTSDFVRLDTLPLLETGDIDRVALANLVAHGRHEGLMRTVPVSAIERAVAGIWKELIGVNEVFVEDSFFDLGGHSLLATQMLSRLRQRLGVELSMRDLFQASSLGVLAALVAERQSAASNSLENLVAEIERLSGDDVRAQLTQTESSAGEMD